MMPNGGFPLGRSPSINSVGQRPTNTFPQNHKPCKGEIKHTRITPFQGLWSREIGYEGRCPLLLIEGLRPNGRFRKEDVV